MSTGTCAFSHVVGFFKRTNVKRLKMHKLGQEAVRFRDIFDLYPENLFTLFNFAKLWGYKT